MILRWNDVYRRKLERERSVESVSAWKLIFFILVQVVGAGRVMHSLVGAHLACELFMLDANAVQLVHPPITLTSAWDLPPPSSLCGCFQLHSIPVLLYVRVNH